MRREAYSIQTRTEAVQKVIQRQASASQVAQQLGCPVKRVYKWVAAFKKANAKEQIVEFAPVRIWETTAKASSETQSVQKRSNADGELAVEIVLQSGTVVKISRISTGCLLDLLRGLSC